MCSDECTPEALIDSEVTHVLVILSAFTLLTGSRSLQVLLFASSHFNFKNIACVYSSQAGWNFGVIQNSPKIANKSIEERENFERGLGGHIEVPASYYTM